MTFEIETENLQQSEKEIEEIQPEFSDVKPEVEKISY